MRFLYCTCAIFLLAATAGVRTPRVVLAGPGEEDLLHATRSYSLISTKAMVAVVLTGMGDDGLRGSHAISESGGRLLTESESSCVVYGMPRCVKEAGLSRAEATLSMARSSASRS